MVYQTNARLSDDVGVLFERWASERGMTNGALAKEVLTAVVEARREGRTIFEPPEMPSAADITRQVQAFRELTTEVKRVLEQNAKRDADAVKQGRTDAEAMTAARNEFLTGLPTRLSSAYAPFKAELLRIEKLLVEHPVLVAMNDQLGGIRRSSEQPKTENLFVLTDNLKYTIGYLTALTLLIGLLLLVLFLAVSSTMQGTRVFAADRIFRTDQAVCGYLDERYGGTECQVPPVKRFVEPAPPKRKSA